jgi:hypothetical protein
MRHPFQIISLDRLGTYLFPFVVAALAIMLTLNFINAPLQTDSAPLGIISFEFAGNVDSAQAVIESWNFQAQKQAAFSIGYDYLFLVTYSTAIALACIWASKFVDPSNAALINAGVLLAWGQWLAALCDGVENAALFISLVQQPISPLPEIARITASLKFVLILLGLIYVTLILFLRLILPGKIDRQPEDPES